jgi:hypothetical protein
LGDDVSIQAVAWALEQDLPARAKLCLVAIANHANHTTGYCWLEAETIAREASCSARSVWRFVGALARNGYIRKARRKGDDGKQRANDYWIMFGRPEAPWIKQGHEPDDDVEPDEGAKSGSQILGGGCPDPQQDGLPDDTVSYGQESNLDHPQPVEKPLLAYGPCATGVTRIESAEPSKTNPEKDARARDREPQGLITGPPRAYRPPPPLPEEPMGAIIADREAKQIFVYQGSRAWNAWCAHKFRKTGIRWSLTTTALIDGKWRSGWYFPSLFPPPETATGPPATITKDDQAFIDKQGGLG